MQKSLKFNTTPLIQKDLVLHIFPSILIIASLWMSPANAFMNDNSETTETLTIISEHIANATSRAPLDTYVMRDTKVPWVEDFFNFYKYAELRRDEKDAFLFFMTAPSQTYFTAIYAIGRQNNMFQPPFTYYDGFSGTTKTLEKNYLYIDKTNYYEEFLKGSIIDPITAKDIIQPGDSTVLTRVGSTQTSPGTGGFNNLIYTSTINDMIFSYFFKYCPEGYEEMCPTILESSSASGALEDTGSSSTSPSGGINPESLMATSSFATGSSAHIRARDFINIITDPIPRTLVPFKDDPDQPGVIVPDVSNPIQIARNITSRARRGVSQYVLNDIKSRRHQSYDAEGSSVTGVAGSLSSMEFLHQLAMNRLLTSNNWLVELNVASPEALQREMVLIQASQLMFQHQAFKQNENIEFLLATLVAQNEDLSAAIYQALNPDVAAIQASVGAVI